VQRISLAEHTGTERKVPLSPLVHDAQTTANEGDQVGPRNDGVADPQNMAD
jgi:hypothetical protein